MEQKRIKVRLTKNSPYSEYGYYEKGDIGYIDGYVNDNAVIILENGKFAKANLRWIEVINEKDEVNIELRESEDEKIRKEMIEIIKNEAHEFPASVIAEKSNSWLAWLEKQGEQKPADNKGMNIDEESMTPFQKKVFCIIDTAIEEEQGLKQVCDELLALASNEIEQNPAWSEEDKRIIDNLVSQLGNLYARKLIKEETKDKYVNWLKSLRPQNKWKPSDEQMNALAEALSLAKNCGEECAFDIRTLYEQLKKLKDE